MATRQKKPLSVNSFAVKMTFGTQTSNLFWTKCSAIKKTYGTSEYSDGQSNVKYKLPGAISYDDVTLSKPFVDGDEEIVALILAANSKPEEYISVDIQPMYRDGYSSANIGGSYSLKYCTVVSFSAPEVDTGGDSVAMIEVVLSPGFVESQGSKQFWREPTATT